MKLKKALAAVLSAAMIITSLPAAAFAAEDNGIAVLPATAVQPSGEDEERIPVWTEWDANEDNDNEAVKDSEKKETDKTQTVVEENEAENPTAAKGGKSSVAVLEGESENPVQEETGWYYDTSVDRLEDGNNGHRYRHTSDDVTDMTDARYVPADISDLITKVGEAGNYEEQKELVAQAVASGKITKSLQNRWCGSDGNFITEFTNGGYTINFEKNEDGKTYTAVVSGEGNSYSDKIEWSGATQQWILYRTTLIISKKPGNTGISRDIRTEFTTDLLLSD